MIKVCSVMRATSKRLCFIASMALSNSTLSGCFDPTLANGLTAFLLVQPTVSASRMASPAINENRRDIRPRYDYVGTAVLGCPPERSSAFLLPLLDFQQRGFGSRLEQSFSILSWVILAWITKAEHRVARHQDFSACAYHIAHRVVPHPAIHFDAVSQPALAANLH